MKHFSIMNCTLLSDAFIIRTVEVKCSEGAIVPVEHTCYTDNAVDIELVISQVELLQRHGLFFIA